MMEPVSVVKKHHASAIQGSLIGKTAGSEHFKSVRIICVICVNNVESSNGRMQASEACHVGSTPSSTATKLCGRCQQIKSTNLFGKRGKGFQSWCKDCKNSWDRENYYNNHSNRKLQIRKRTELVRIEGRKLVLSYLQQGCIDCFNMDIRVLEFDHLRDKEFDIMRAVNEGYSLVRLKKEIEKCEVVCANCHKIRTIDRSKSWRYYL